MINLVGPSYIRENKLHFDMVWTTSILQRHPSYSHLDFCLQRLRIERNFDFPAAASVRCHFFIAFRVMEDASKFC
jgi:hypothetical protein